MLIRRDFRGVDARQPDSVLDARKSSRPQLAFAIAAPYQCLAQACLSFAREVGLVVQPVLTRRFYAAICALQIRIDQDPRGRSSSRAMHGSQVLARYQINRRWRRT